MPISLQQSTVQLVVPVFIILCEAPAGKNWSSPIASLIRFPNTMTSASPAISVVLDRSV